MTEARAWALAADLLTEQEAAGTWKPDPDDPDAWGLERERIAYTLLKDHPMTSPLLSALTASTPGPDMHAATQTAAHWLDIMPALPTSSAVPVVRVEYPSVPDMRRISHRTVRLSDAVTPDTQTMIERIDLDDPQGYAYALRYACQHCDPAISYLWPSMASRWMRGETTGTDRLALAQALAEVQA